MRFWSVTDLLVCTNAGCVFTLFCIKALLGGTLSCSLSVGKEESEAEGGANEAVFFDLVGIRYAMFGVFEGFDDWIPLLIAEGGHCAAIGLALAYAFTRASNCSGTDRIVFFL